MHITDDAIYISSISHSSLASQYTTPLRIPNFDESVAGFYLATAYHHDIENFNQKLVTQDSLQNCTRRFVIEMILRSCDITGEWDLEGPVEKQGQETNAMEELFHHTKLR
jgi:hypothetical protein